MSSKIIILLLAAISMASGVATRPLTANSYYYESLALTYSTTQSSQPVRDYTNQLTFGYNADQVRHGLASDRRAYVDDIHFEDVLRQLGTDSPISNDRDNYISDDMSLNEILNLIEARESYRSTMTPASVDVTSQSNSITNPVESLTTRLAITTTEKPVEECPICYEPLDSKPQTITPCAHKFHLDCLYKWKILVSRFEMEIN